MFQVWSRNDAALWEGCSSSSSSSPPPPLSTQGPRLDSSFTEWLYKTLSVVHLFILLLILPPFNSWFFGCNCAALLAVLQRRCEPLTFSSQVVAEHCFPKATGTLARGLMINFLQCTLKAGDFGCPVIFQPRFMEQDFCSNWIMIEIKAGGYEKPLQLIEKMHQCKSQPPPHLPHPPSPTSPTSPLAQSLSSCLVCCSASFLCLSTMLTSCSPLKLLILSSGACKGKLATLASLATGASLATTIAATLGFWILDFEASTEKWTFQWSQ